MNVLFLDTNVLNGNQSFNQLFGKREELEELSKYFKIVIPDIVIEELINHKRKQFEREVSLLNKSTLFAFLEYDKSKLSSCTFEDIRQACLDGETIAYDSCPVGDPARFQETFLPLALGNQPPFEKSNDKGYKDACFSNSILTFMGENPDNVFFSYTRDGRLLEFLRSIDNLATFSNYKDLIRAIAPQQQPAETPMSNNNDSNSSAGVITNLTIKSAIDELSVSNSFQTTHHLVHVISDNRDNLSFSDKKSILRSAVDNTQVKWLLNDSDVRELIIPIFNELGDELTDSDYLDFINAADLPNERTDDYGNPQYSFSERTAYKSFADSFVNHLMTRDYGSSIDTDTAKMTRNLRALIASSSLDPDCLTWRRVCRCIILGGYTVDSAKAERDPITKFCDLLDSSSPKKKADIIRMLNDKFEFEVDEELPF